MQLDEFLGALLGEQYEEFQEWLAARAAAAAGEPAHQEDGPPHAHGPVQALASTAPFNGSVPYANPAVMPTGAGMLLHFASSKAAIPLHIVYHLLFWV